MLSDSDDRVSDHGRQIIESIEPIEDVSMEDADSSGDGRREAGMSGPPAGIASLRGELAKSEPVSDDGSEDSGDEALESGGGSDSPKQAAKFRAGPRQKINGSKNEGAASEDDSQLAQSQSPPSYQVPPEVGSELPSHGIHSTDSTDSTDSTASEVEEGSRLNDVTLKMEKSRKRKSSMDVLEPESMDGAVDPRPEKKTRHSLNRAYLDLLNQDIEYAASTGCQSEHERMDGRAALPASQIGLIFWTSMEKELFFEALGRLGRDNTAGIAERIHTKGEMEVRQYLKLLQDALTYRRQQNELEPLGLEDFPSAMEISHECCQALEQVADNITLREERAEVAAEEDEFGPDWLVSPENCKRLEDDAEDDVSKASGVFRIKEWLSLSERFFMNGPTAEGNWQSVDGHVPSVRRTTLNDFYLLALTLTRRLVAASRYMAMTRIRAESGYRRQVREFVKSKDVHAAALSMGLATQKPPLTGCVRRLGLSVYENPPKPDEDSNVEPISITDVEEVLNIEGRRNVSYLRRQMERVALSDDASLSSDSPMESGMDSEQERADRSASGDNDDSQEEEDVQAEANEAILYSAVDPPQTKRDRQALYRRIKAEREQERYADAVDAQKGFHEEMKLWKLLGQQPPKDLIDPGTPPVGRRVNLSVDTGYSVGRDWRAKTKAVSEWEAQYSSLN